MSGSAKETRMFSSFAMSAPRRVLASLGLVALLWAAILWAVSA